MTPLTDQGDTGSSRPHRFAEVAVPVPAGVPGRHAAVGRPDRQATFTYSVPESLAGQLAPGHVVWVPFGRRRLQGVVVALRDNSPVDRTRDIAELVGEQPMLLEEQMALARWLSLHYLAPFFECLRAMMPPGALSKAVKRYRRTEKRVRPEELEGQRLAVLSAFGRDRELTLEQIRRRSKIADPASALDALVADGLLDVHTRFTGGRTRPRREAWRDPLEGREGEPTNPLPPTPDQQRAWELIEPMLGRDDWTDGRPTVTLPARPKVCLVHGVTGSGKTELYLRAVDHVLRLGRQAIVLVPEIALTPQTVARIAGRFPARVGLWHSQMSDGERADTWQRAREGALDVIVGSRSAVFAPLERLGLIVVDEEHATAYKQPRTPRYHARDVAVQRAMLCGGVVLLGSATPSIESHHAARTGTYKLAQLPRRLHSVGDGFEWAELPPVRVIDMRAELRTGNTSIFSRALQTGLARVLDEGQQAILFLNRRGSSTFVSCRDCGHVMQCARCEMPLTYHGQGRALVCHHCGHREAPPMLCPACGSDRIRYFGAGTQRVEEQVRQLLPQARVLRWDTDTTTRKGAHEAIMDRFASGQADILVGTQMVAKGLDLPRVTLVGVISADTALHLPDFRSRERTFEMLSQVAGRTGRSHRGGEVIIQTYVPEDPAIRFAAEHDYSGFYEAEIAHRRAAMLPPFREIARLEYLTKSGDAAAEKETQLVADTLRLRIDQLGLPDTDVVGPAPAYYGYVRGRSRWQVIVRSRQLQELLRSVDLRPGWRIDVDPVSLL